MKLFQRREIRAAIDYAMDGKQALHLHHTIANWRKAPLCFRREVNAGRAIAHLFDQDVIRLVATARFLGVRVILIERRNQPGQHIDLCGKPLDRARILCKEENHEQDEDENQKSTRLC